MVMEKFGHILQQNKVNLTIQFFNTEPRVMEKLRHILQQNKVRVRE